MSALREKIIAMQAQLADLLAEVERESGAQPVADPVYLDVDAFAKRHGLCADTVRRYAKDGMPHERAGRFFRIIVADADAWLRDGNAHTNARRDGILQARKAG